MAVRMRFTWTHRGRGRGKRALPDRVITNTDLGASHHDPVRLPPGRTGSVASWPRLTRPHGFHTLIARPQQALVEPPVGRGPIAAPGATRTVVDATPWRPAGSCDITASNCLVEPRMRVIYQPLCGTSLSFLQSTIPASLLPAGRRS